MSHYEFIPSDDLTYLQAILDYCINISQWKPRWITLDAEWLVCRSEDIRINDEVWYSYHDLFSQESWLLEDLFVPLQRKESMFVFETWIFKDQVSWILPHLFNMSVMNEQQKVAYYVNNIILPPV